jgi:hypothetical protein
MFFTQLSTSHDLSNFDCGDAELNAFLKRYASLFPLAWIHRALPPVARVPASHGLFCIGAVFYTLP